MASEAWKALPVSTPSARVLCNTFYKHVPTASALYPQYVLSSHLIGRKEMQNGCELASLVSCRLRSEPPASSPVARKDGLSPLCRDVTLFFLDAKCCSLLGNSFLPSRLQG